MVRLTKCRSCGALVARTARICFACGRPRNVMTSNMTALTLLLALLGLAALWAGH